VSTTCGGIERDFDTFSDPSKRLERFHMVATTRHAKPKKQDLDLMSLHSEQEIESDAVHKEQHVHTIDSEKVEPQGTAEEVVEAVEVEDVEDVSEESSTDSYYTSTLTLPSVKNELAPYNVIYRWDIGGREKLMKV
jgi:hypothetical protein